MSAHVHPNGSKSITTDMYGHQRLENVPRLRGHDLTGFVSSRFDGDTWQEFTWFDYATSTEKPTPIVRRHSFNVVYDALGYGHYPNHRYAINYSSIMGGYYLQ